jgi:hypothetical protein
VSLDHTKSHIYRPMNLINSTRYSTRALFEFSDPKARKHIIFRKRGTYAFVHRFTPSHVTASLHGLLVLTRAPFTSPCPFYSGVQLYTPTAHPLISPASLYLLISHEDLSQGVLRTRPFFCGLGQCRERGLRLRYSVKLMKRASRKDKDHREWRKSRERPPAWRSSYATWIFWPCGMSMSCRRIPVHLI